MLSESKNKSSIVDQQTVFVASDLQESQIFDEGIVNDEQRLVKQQVESEDNYTLNNL